MPRGGGCALHFLGEAWEPHSSQEPGFIVGYTASNVSGCVRARTAHVSCVSACGAMLSLVLSFLLILCNTILHK